MPRKSSRSGARARPRGDAAKIAGGARTWTRARATLAAEHAGLGRALARLACGRLDGPAVAKGSSRYAQIHGMIQHDRRHAGQIVILRPALEGRSRRTRGS